MVARSISKSQALYSLQKRWLGFVLYGLLLVSGGYGLINAWWEPRYALHWLVFSIGAIAYQLWVLWANLEKNHPPGSEGLFPDLGAGNVASLVRGGFIAITAGFLFMPRPPGRLAWLPGLAYTVAALLDFVDGYLARVTDRQTHLGEVLDITLDGLGVLITTILVVQFKQVPVWYLLVGLARYLFLGGLWIRRRMGKPIYDLPPNITRRAMAGLQMGFLFVLLWPVFSPPVTVYSAIAIALPFLVNFLWDWFLVSGVVSANTIQPLASLKRFSVLWLPLVLRVGVVVLLASQVGRWFLNRPDQVFFYTRQGVSDPLSFGWAMATLEIFVLLSFFLGVAGRITAIVGLVLLGAYQAISGLTTIQVILMFIFWALLHSGTGSYSLWKPEERFIFRKAGER